MHLAKFLLELAMGCPACASLANQQGPMLSKDCSAVIGTQSRPAAAILRQYITLQQQMYGGSVIGFLADDWLTAIIHS